MAVPGPHVAAARMLCNLVQSLVVIDIILTLITQQKLSTVSRRPSCYDSDFDRVRVGEIDGLLVAVGRSVSR